MAIIAIVCLIPYSYKALPHKFVPYSNLVSLVNLDLVLQTVKYAQREDVTWTFSQRVRVRAGSRIRFCRIREPSRIEALETLDLEFKFLTDEMALCKLIQNLWILSSFVKQILLEINEKTWEKSHECLIYNRGLIYNAFLLFIIFSSFSLSCELVLSITSYIFARKWDKTFEIILKNLKSA